MPKTLDDVVDALKPIIQGMASSAKMPEYGEELNIDIRILQILCMKRL